MIDFFRANLPYGIRNLIRWFPLIWRDRDWDYCYLADLMRFKMLRMADLQRRWGHHVGAERHARQLRICAALCQRISEDNYIQMHDCPNSPPGQWHRRVEFSQRYDLEYLGIMMRRHMATWWD
jgi:hypothetical protein